jgi:hypothetical protein
MLRGSIPVGTDTCALLLYIRSVGVQVRAVSVQHRTETVCTTDSVHGGSALRAQQILSPCIAKLTKCNFRYQEVTVGAPVNNA